MVINTGGMDVPNWKAIFEDLKTTEQTFTVYLRYQQKDTLAKIINVRVFEVHDEYVKLENPSGFGILAYEDVLYLVIPKQ
ncbi:MAG: hypothetical protein ACXADS_06975 [Candidatus Thorarchaeota archaeon]